MLPGPRRRRSPAQPIIEFWTWWPSARARLTADLAGGGGLPMAAEISARVKAIHPRLEWELAQGVVAQHAFMASCGGSPEARASAARWHALAPRADEMWEFHDSRTPKADFATATLALDGRELTLADIRFETRPREHTVDVTVLHPVLGILPQRLSARLALLCLQWALGEQAVDVWVGGITFGTAAAPQYTVERLREEVTGVADRHAQPHWASLTGETAEGHEFHASIQVPLRGARWPRFDVHIAVTVPIPRDGKGLPTTDALEVLRTVEESSTSALHSDGELLAHETRDGTRTFHFYADADILPGARLAWVAGHWPRVRAHAELDPMLLAIRHLDVGR